MATDRRRVVVTGMSINTPLGDDLDTFYAALLAGRSAITRWKFFEHEGVYSKVGGDLSDYDFGAKLSALRARLPESLGLRLRQLCRKAPFSTRLSMLAAADAWLDAGLDAGIDPARGAVLIGGHNLNTRYLIENYNVFRDEPDYIDSQGALLTLDTDHAGSVSEVLGWHGAAYTMGGACASANLALRSALDEIRYHDHDMAMLVGGVLDFTDMDLHAMALIGAITVQSFNDDPERASRPYDVRREGFVPSHGTAGLVLEELEHARARGARIYAEVLGCTATADGCHLPSPSTAGQARTISRLLDETRVAPEEVDFVSAHATSTPLGDLSELQAIKQVFQEHAYHLRINAPKSMLGHTCWSAPVVETVAALLQLRGGRLHPSINIEELDPQVDLDICADGPVDHAANVILKNSFGFGGLNCCALFRRLEMAG